MTTTLRKGVNGWVAETLIPMPELPNSERTGEPVEAKLSIRTSGGQGRIGTHCGVEWHGAHFVTYAMFSDFAKNVSRQAGRGTEKAVNQAHSLALLQAESLKAEALAFYAAKES